MWYIANFFRNGVQFTKDGQYRKPKYCKRKMKNKIRMKKKSKRINRKR